MTNFIKGCQEADVVVVEEDEDEAEDEASKTSGSPNSAAQSLYFVGSTGISRTTWVHSPSVPAVLGAAVDVVFSGLSECRAACASFAL